MLAAIGAALGEWSRFILLVLLGVLLRNLIAAAYKRLHARIDAKVPDDMPVGAGTWLEQEIARRSLALRVLVAGESAGAVDCYWPSARVIILSSRVFRKHDASFWAIAAHELGHALVYRRMTLLHLPLLFARVIQLGCTQLATFLIFANVLYALPEINDVAFLLLVASLVGYVLVLVDEALASIIAIGILVRDGRVGRRALIGAVTALLAAFMTYAGGFVGQLVLVLQRDFIVAKIMEHRHFATGTPVGGLAIVLVHLLALALVAFSVLAIARSFRKRDAKTSAEVSSQRLRAGGVELARGFFGVAIVAIVWDQPLGAAFAIVCVVGLVASRAFVDITVKIARGLLGLFAALVVVIVMYGVLYLVILPVAWVLEGLQIRLFSASKSSYEPPPPPPSPESTRFKEAIAATFVELYNRPSWYEVLSTVGFAALHIAFVIAVYVKLFRAA